MLYSKSTKGFYDREIHGNAIPSDAIEITDAEYTALLTEQANGKLIVSDINGKPVAIDPKSLLDIDQIKALKIAALAAYRYERETGGLTVGDTVIKTDRQSQAMLNGAQTYFAMNPDATVNWKAENGWFQINQSMAAAIAQAVASHIQTCFTNERAHFEAISELITVAEIEAYDFTTGWPS